MNATAICDMPMPWHVVYVDKFGFPQMTGYSFADKSAAESFAKQLGQGVMNTEQYRKELKAAAKRNGGAA